MIKNIYYACKDLNNFGDLLGPYIFQKITGQTPIFTEKLNAAPHYFLVGSILQEATKETLVLGAGFGAKTQQLIKRPRRITLVRGPITGNLLNEQGYQISWDYGDPSLVLPLLYTPKANYLGGYFLVLPHYIDAPLPVFKQLTTPYLLGDITQPIEKVIDAIVNSKGVITSSLHGLIVAQTYGVPVALVKFSDKIAGDGMKYLDYWASVGLTPKKIPLIKNFGAIKNINVENEKINFSREKLLARLVRDLQ